MSRLGLEYPNTFHSSNKKPSPFLSQVRSSAGTSSGERGSSDSVSEPLLGRSSTRSGTSTSTNTANARQKPQSVHCRSGQTRNLPTARNTAAAEGRDGPRNNERQGGFFGIVRQIVRACQDTADLWLRNARALWRGTARLNPVFNLLIAIEVFFIAITLPSSFIGALSSALAFGAFLPFFVTPDSSYQA